MDIETAIADIHGLVSTQAFERAGTTRREVARLASKGRIHRVTRGWYVPDSVAQRLNELPAAERRKGWHDLTSRATVNVFDGRVVASHHSALVRHGLPTYCADLSTVHVTRVADDHSRARRGLVVHECVEGAAFSDDLVMAPAIAIVQTGMTNGPMAALIAADAALHRGLIRSEDLAHAVTLIGGPRAWPVVRILSQTDGRSESPGETRLREVLRLMGLPAMTQVELHDSGFRAVVDFLLVGSRVVIEFDGFVKYGRPETHRVDATPADVLFAEKVREDHIRGLGYVVVRVVWSELDDLPALRRKILAAVALSRIFPAA